MARIGILTFENLPELSSDDQLLREALIRKGYEVSQIIWDQIEDNPAVDLLVVRSIWDYHKKYDSFLKWLKLAESRNWNVQNPVPVLRWNSDKMYLKELRLNGLPIVPTRWLHHNEKNITLHDIIQDQEWSDVVVKPVVSASALRTERVLLKDVERFEPIFQKWLSQHSLMVQPFFQEICTFGEWSLLYFGGNYSHAILKKPKSGDFRVQAEFGGTTHKLDPPESFKKLSDRIIAFMKAKFGTDCLYARIDLIDYSGHPLIGELELIEPFLFFSYDEKSVQRFVDAVSRTHIGKL